MDHKKNSPDTVEFPLTIDQKYHKLIIKFELTYASVYASSRENDAIWLCLLTDELRKQVFFYILIDYNQWRPFRLSDREFSLILYKTSYMITKYTITEFDSILNRIIIFQFLFVIHS